MASFDDDADPAAGSGDEFDNEDEEMEDANEPEADPDQDDDQNAEDDEEDEVDGDDNDNDNDDDDDDDQNEAESPSRRLNKQSTTRETDEGDTSANPAVVLTSPSPRPAPGRSPAKIVASYIPPTRPEALTAQVYDIVPTMAAPQGTSINAIAATPDMRWVFSGGTDGYIRMFNWVETANGKVPLTVAQKHPFVDSVMKAGSLLTYWENEEPQLRTPPKDADEEKYTSPVYSLAVQNQAVWLLSGLESGGINLQTTRHQAGSRITTLKEHTSAVSVLSLSLDETSVLSGSWDKNIHDWDLHTGKVKRSFKDSGSQISAIETRPMSDVPIPEVSESLPIFSSTFSSNSFKRSNGFTDGRDMKGNDEDALGSPSGSLFGEGDHSSLFGEDTTGPAGGGFGDYDDDLGGELTGDMPTDHIAPIEQDDTEMGGMGSGGPVQAPPADANTNEKPSGSDDLKTDGPEEEADGAQTKPDDELTSATSNGLPHSDEPLTAPPTEENVTATSLSPQSESTFLDAAIDGTIRIWDRRMPNPIATLVTYGGTPPWCTGACWSPDGNFLYAGRRNCTVEEYSIHHLGTNRSKPNRVFKFQQGSGPVYAVRSMPNKKHLVCASQDILRIYDLAQSEQARHRTVPFTIVPGHRGGVISAIHIDPTCRFMLSAAGNRGWEGGGTEVLLGYEIGVQDESGVWHK